MVRTDNSGAARLHTREPHAATRAGIVSGLLEGRMRRRFDIGPSRHLWKRCSPTKPPRFVFSQNVVLRVRGTWNL